MVPYVDAVVAVTVMRVLLMRGVGEVFEMCICLARGGVGVVDERICRWQVQVSVYGVWHVHVHLRCTQCSILLHLMDICFLTCICL